MRRLSEAQKKALASVESSPGQITWHRRSTLEALRRLGLIERYTHFSIRAEWACGDQIVEQWRLSAKTPHPVDDWAITHAGRSALAQSEEKK